MKVLVACEFSGIVRDAFRERGHDAMSCDLLPTERPGPHYQGDVRELLREWWDLVIAHPPCTTFSRARGTPAPWTQTAPAIEFFQHCQEANAPRVAVENVRTFRFVRRILGQPSFEVQPFHFGDMYWKSTCWWVKNLPPLMPTLHLGKGVKVPHLVGTGDGRSNPKHQIIETRDASDRARFHPGMAAAMADQWGSL